MAGETREAAAPRLEGLLLFDGAEYYELPYAVIARYRVPHERRADVLAAPERDAGQPLPWLVHAGIYAPEELR